MDSLQELGGKGEEGALLRACQGADGGVAQRASPGPQLKSWYVSASDIEEVLRNEIVARYYFQTGRAKAGLATDPYVNKPIELLNGARYNEVLAGTKTGK